MWSKLGGAIQTLGFFREQWGAPYFIFEFHANREILANPRSLLLYLIRDRRVGDIWGYLGGGEVALATLRQRLSSGEGTVFKLTLRKELPPALHRAVDEFLHCRADS